LKRTSETHPLFVKGIAVGPGTIGVTLCPGKRGNSVMGAPWARDLETDLRAIRDWGAHHVLTLTEAPEMEMLGVSGLGAAVSNHGMTWHHLPIRDLGAPDADARADWARLSPELHRALDAGKRILVHCRGGLGRAGTMAALLLIERGDSAEQAMARVREARPGAIETVAQERFLKDRAALEDPRATALRACLFGCAIGDSLGAEIEFWPLSRIRARFPEAVDTLLPHDGRKGAITDDTQMTLFTAEGLIRAVMRDIGKGICYAPGVVHHALLRWLVTQGERPVMETCATGLVAETRLHHRRAPGMTCLSALRASRNFGDLAQNDSKGCGTIMRVAPVAFSPLGTDVARLARETSALTHGHTTGQEAAVAWAQILAAVLDGDDLEHAAGKAAEGVGTETALAIKAACAAPRDGRPETVATLGEGWVAEEALAIALYACLCARDPETGWRIAVTHSGDSDSTGAIAGALLGILHSAEVMSHRWRSEIECADIIDRLARDLATVTSPGIRDDRAQIDILFRTYPGW
jgi:ADP-ribosylglycohydrolase